MGHSNTCGPVTAAQVDSELLALGEHFSTQLAPPSTGWRETGEEAGPAATVEAGDGRNCTCFGGGRNIGSHFYRAVASTPSVNCLGNQRT